MTAPLLLRSIHRTLLNAIFPETGDEYETAYNKSQYSLVFGISIVETIVELLGCGVGLNQMTLAPLLVFLPSLDWSYC